MDKEKKIAEGKKVFSITSYAADTNIVMYGGRTLTELIQWITRAKGKKFRVISYDEAKEYILCNGWTLIGLLIGLKTWGNAKKFGILEYKEVREHLQDGDVIMYSGWKRVSLFIRMLTRSKYSHAGIVVKWLERLMAMEAIHPFIIVDPLSRSVNRYKGRVDWFSCRETNAFAVKMLSVKTNRQKMIQFAQENLGGRYSIWKLVSFLLLIFFKRKTKADDRLRRYDQKLTCSEYVARVYNSIGVDLLHDRADRFTTPKNIAESECLRYRGTFNSMGDNREDIFLQVPLEDINLFKAAPASASAPAAK